jgi:beta-N-acetylhexosaminidase
MSAIELPLGPLIVGIDGLELDDVTRDRLRHPAIGGVILFSRNYRSPSQLRELCAAIARLRSPRLLITVDQEGGRVQRFREGFTALPPLGRLGRFYRSHPDRARDLAYRHGRVMAAEVLGHGVDLSWAPVLDLDRGSEVIGDRALGAEPEMVCDLGAFYLAGMHDAGMRSCGKHFPGHGSVVADSHHEVVVDRRPLTDLAVDLQPFTVLAPQLDGVMMAHVCYPARDERPAGFSGEWVGQCLRAELDFTGVVVSDDLDMQGATPGGDLAARLRLALAAGCEAVLVCRPASVAQLLGDGLELDAPAVGRLEGLYGRPLASLEEQLTVPEFRAWRESLEKLSEG